MGQDTEQLKRDIEGTRSDMSATLDAIGDRVSPGRVVERNKNKVIVGARSLKDRVMGTASETQEHLADTAQSARDALSGAASQATDAVKHMPDAVVHHTEGAPMVAGAIAFGVGFLIAASMPSSQAEVTASAKLLESLEPIKQDLTETAHDMAEHLKEPAIEAAQSVKDAAAEGAHAVADTARDSAQQTTQHAKESIDAVTAGNADLSSSASAPAVDTEEGIS
jgi:hypothetical protein